jgi:hypothetical protein
MCNTSEAGQVQQRRPVETTDDTPETGRQPGTNRIDWAGGIVPIRLADGSLGGRSGWANSLGRGFGSKATETDRIWHACTMEITRWPSSPGTAWPADGLHPVRLDRQPSAQSGRLGG